MASNNDNNTVGQPSITTSSEAGGSSAQPSPTDLRYPPPRFEPIVEDDNQSEDAPSSSTVRRRTETPTSGYGTISPMPRESSSLRPDGGERASSRASNQIRSPMLGPERRGQKAKKPVMPRRASSNVMGPHRGQEFSVDDDVSEVEGVAFARQQSASGPSGGTSSLRHQSSTLRRRPTTQMPQLPRVESNREGEDNFNQRDSTESIHGEPSPVSSGEEGTIRPDHDSLGDDEDDGDISDAESFTLKDRQEAINETHPFGIRIWKPALYKKNRSVQRTAEGDIHSSPGMRVNSWLLLFNLLWTILFGWWLALIAFIAAVVCFIFAVSPSSVEYGRVLWGLSSYLFYPFGKVVRLAHDEAYMHEDEGEGRPITEYEQWQSGDIEDGRLFFGPDEANRSIIGRSRRSIDSAMSETESLLGRHRRGHEHGASSPRMKRRLFGRGEWTLGRVIFFLFFYGLITPCLFLVSGICWFMVFWIPMGKVTMLLFSHLRRHPLALSFQSDSAYSRASPMTGSSVLVCTYRAVGLTYWKYTVDGTNIFLINLMGVVLFVIFDYWVLLETLHLDLAITHPAFLFIMALSSIIPLAYFIGQAVASISAQSSMGLGAAINAFFSTIVEVFLYCVALKQGKGQLVEGSIIGSIFAGILFLPGLSMCCGAIKRKTQRFNAKSAGVTSTMLLFAVIAAFGPTLFYQIYGTHELNCLSCVDTGDLNPSRDCRRCYFSQVPTLDDRFYISAVRPFVWFAAILLFLSYSIGLWFTLRTHAAVIWNSEVDEKKQTADAHMASSWHGGQSTRGSRPQMHHTDTANELRDSQLYRRIIDQSLQQAGLASPEDVDVETADLPQTPHLVPPKSSGGESHREGHSGLSGSESSDLVHKIAEIAATAAINATHDPRGSRKQASRAHSLHKGHTHRAATVVPDDEVGAMAAAEGAGHEGGGHDAPNWSRTKSSIILMGATVLYAIIAEILVDTVDVVLQRVAIDEKFLGITLFALVPNTTEFLNAISFAMNGNIALSMEIGSAYALQVCLLQVPALVLFSALSINWMDPVDAFAHTFTMIFPQWDMVTVILCVFLLSYMYGEGKSNYFKGSILLLSYLVVVVGFWFSGMTDIESMGASRFDILQAGGSFKTIGKGKSGYAFPQ